MKQSSHTIIPSKALRGVFDNFNLEGLTESSLVLFLCEVLEKSKFSFFLSFETKEKAFRFYRAAQEFNNSFLFYPETSFDSSVPGFNSEESIYAKESLIGLSSDNRFCCIGTKESFSEKNIPSGLKKGVQELRLRVGASYELSTLIEFLNLNGYSKTELVYQSGYYSNRGDVLDVYPKHFNKPCLLTLMFLSRYQPLTL